jgi:hypothetical protein
VHKNPANGSALVTTSDIAIDQAFAVASDVKYKLFEGGARVTSFLRNVNGAANDFAANMAAKVINDGKGGGGAERRAESSVLMTDINSMFSSAVGGGQEPQAAAAAADSARKEQLTKARTVPSSLLATAESTLGDLGDFDVIDEVAPIAKLTGCKRKSPVTRAEWDALFDADGRLIDEDELRKCIFHGGATPEIRRDVWIFLLGHRAPSTAEASTYYADRKQQYLTMKQQWETVTFEQMARNKYLRERVERVAKDVSRTDREDPFFEAADSPNLAMLNDVLMTWCVYNFDLGYVQGMSDLLSMILRVVEDEVDSFWCFVGMMDSNSIDGDLMSPVARSGE